MAAVFAGAARAPFTAILIVFEMTDDYRLIVPLMAAVIVSLIVAERLHRESIYTLKLTRRGIHLRRGQVIDVMDSVRVEEVMVPQPVTVPVDLPVELLANEFIRTGRHGFPVVDDAGRLYGVVSLEDYRRIIGKGTPAKDHLTVGEIATRDLVTIYPDESVAAAMRRMVPRDLSRLPVITRDDPHHLVGVVRRNDIVRAYELGVLRREEARHRADANQALSHSRAEFLDVRLPAESHAVGLTIAELKLPRSAVLVSIRRGRELVIPHGDTRLAPGDVVTALCEREWVHEIETELTRVE
jgi:CIC family chloride channel protein